MQSRRIRKPDGAVVAINEDRLVADTEPCIASTGLAGQITPLVSAVCSCRGTDIRSNWQQAAIWSGGSGLLKAPVTNGIISADLGAITGVVRRSCVIMRFDGRSR